MAAPGVLSMTSAPEAVIVWLATRAPVMSGARMVSAPATFTPPVPAPMMPPVPVITTWLNWLMPSTPVPRRIAPAFSVSCPLPVTGVVVRSRAFAGLSSEISRAVSVTSLPSR